MGKQGSLASERSRLLRTGFSDSRKKMGRTTPLVE